MERPYLSKGTLLANKYEILQDINTGSFGHVIMCRSQSGEKVAVKVQDRTEARYHQGQWFMKKKKAHMRFYQVHPENDITFIPYSPFPHPLSQTSRSRLIYYALFPHELVNLTRL
jgi:hypothetical protein